MKEGITGSKPPAEQDKNNQVKRLKHQVADTTEVVLDTIDQLVERGEKLEGLVDKIDQTDDKALEFTGNARKMLVKAKFKSWAMSAAMVGGILGGFYGLGIGASIPMLMASSGIVGALFYGAMWMCSGIIQSGMRLPFLGLSFQSAAHKDEHENADSNRIDFEPTSDIDYSAPLFVNAYQSVSSSNDAGILAKVSEFPKHKNINLK